MDLGTERFLHNADVRVDVRCLDMLDTGDDGMFDLRLLLQSGERGEFLEIRVVV